MYLFLFGISGVCRCWMHASNKITNAETIPNLTIYQQILQNIFHVQKLDFYPTGKCSNLGHSTLCLKAYSALQRVFKDVCVG